MIQRDELPSYPATGNSAADADHQKYCFATHGSGQTDTTRGQKAWWVRGDRQWHYIETTKVALDVY